MKKTIVLGVALVLLLALTAQAAFADYNEDFAKELQNNNVRGIETLLQKRAGQMNLSICLITVLYNNWGGGDLNLNYRNNTMAVMELLVRYGANLNRASSEYYLKNARNRPQISSFPEAVFPLNYAVTNNVDANVIRYLLDNGANPNLKNGRAISSLEHAIRQKNDALITLLLANGVTIDNGAFFRAIADSNFTLASTFLEKKFDINSRGSWATETGTLYISNGTMLMESAYSGNIAAVRYLIENGARVNLRDDNGATAASLAYAKGEVEVYDFLKSQGAIDF